MKTLACIVCFGLFVFAGSEAFAQRGGGGGCRGGGGGPRAMSGGEGARTFTGAFTTAPEVAQQYLMRRQQMEIARQYQMQVQQAATEEAERVAQEADEKKQEKIEAIKKRRADELARREATKARNLAKRKGNASELVSQTRAALPK